MNITYFLNLILNLSLIKKLNIKTRINVKKKYFLFDLKIKDYIYRNKGKIRDMNSEHRRHKTSF